jgi:lycopene cyclase domain-containing protein
MQYEYLLFNVIVIIGPLAMSFEQRIRFFTKWKCSVLAIIGGMIPYIVWDSLVTNRHWFFNPLYTMDMRLLHLPIEEWLFFITVPYACLFIYENLRVFLPGQYGGYHIGKEWIRVVQFSLLPVGILFLRSGKEYTGLVLVALGAYAFLDRQLHTNLLLQPRTAVYAGAVVLCTTIFNWYLTARPVLIYDPQYQLDIRIITIPIEDYVYGWGHILLVTILYEYLMRRFRG